MITANVSDVHYRAAGVDLIGRLVTPQGHQGALPGVLLVPDAVGPGPAAVEDARRIAALGCAVLVADLWGGGRVLTAQAQAEVGGLLAGLVADRPGWLARIAAAHQALADRPGVDPDRLAALGYCVGGSSVLEHLRTGATLRAAVAVHPGLDLLEHDWSRARPGGRVLVSTGSADPMATTEQRQTLQTALTRAAIPWEVDLHGGARHAFTNPFADLAGAPDVLAHDPVATARSRAATADLLTAALSDARPAR